MPKSKEEIEATIDAKMKEECEFGGTLLSQLEAKASKPVVTDKVNTLIPIDAEIEIGE